MDGIAGNIAPRIHGISVDDDRVVGWGFARRRKDHYPWCGGDRHGLVGFDFGEIVLRQDRADGAVEETRHTEVSEYVVRSN